MNIAELFEIANLATVQSFVDNQQEENLQIDFKQIKHASFNSVDDRRNLAKAMSGFANSMGGLIIWGVDARKNENGIDCATSITPFENPKLALTQLETFTGQAASPSVDGVRHKLIEVSAGYGCIVSLIPESKAGPHMAKMGEDRYYKRSGSSFLKMEHFELQDMFGRRAKPDLRLEYSHEKSDEHYNLIKFYLGNIGRSLARHCALIVHFESQIQNVHVISGILTNISSLNNGRITFQYSDNSGVIHPNGARLFLGDIRYQIMDTEFPVKIKIQMYCEDMMPSDVWIELEHL